MQTLPEARSMKVSSSIMIVTSAFVPAGAFPLVTVPAFFRSIVHVASVVEGEGSAGFLRTISKNTVGLDDDETRYNLQL